MIIHTFPNMRERVTRERAKRITLIINNTVDAKIVTFNMIYPDAIFMLIITITKDAESIIYKNMRHLINISSVHQPTKISKLMLRGWVKEIEYIMRYKRGVERDYMLTEIYYAILHNLNFVL